MTRTVTVFVGLTLAGVVACTSSVEGADTGPSGATKGYVTIDAEAFCTLGTKTCGESDTTYEECLKTFKAVRVAPECKTKLDTLTCDTDLAGLDICFPPCTAADEAVCDGPHVTTCGDTGKKYTFECNGICAVQNLTWSGTCGKAFETQTSPTVKCWCR